jgi:hypothetical protein
MDFGSHDPKWMSIQQDRQTSSATHVRSTLANLSEPDESSSSEMESFDEEDMYSAGYDDEPVRSETISDSPEYDGESQSTLRELVWASYQISSQDRSYLK